MVGGGEFRGNVVGVRGADPLLGSAWIFKGGTCLKKCYLETYRFSEDLDFTVIEGGPIEPDVVLAALMPILDRIGQESGIDFTVRAPMLRIRPGGRSAEGRVYYRGPRGAPNAASIKLDLTNDELLVRPPVLRPISHDYPEELPPPAQVRCYGFEEVFAEKLRAMGERARPRDLYDIVNLFRRPDFRQHAALIRNILEQKCAAKGIPLPSVDAIAASPMFTELQAEWANMLAHQLQALPDFDQFWEEMPNLFAWLDGAVLEEPALAPLGAEDEIWTPPATFWATGAGNRLEPIRFAAANHLLVELGYDGRTRLIEPYSLRRTRDGNIVLHAIRAEDGQPRSYRVDRIQSVTATRNPFTPRYAVEFASMGRSRWLPRLHLRRVRSPGTPGERLGARARRTLLFARPAPSGSTGFVGTRGCGRTRIRAGRGTARGGMDTSIASSDSGSGTPVNSRPLEGHIMRAVIYSRMSTDAQERACEALTADRGWSVVRRIRDAASGASLERDGLEELRGILRRGEADMVVAYAVDRLSRNQNHIGILFEEFQRAEAQLEFVTERFEDTAVGRFILTARAFIAEIEREKIAERTMRGKAERARGGRIPQAFGKGCYGYVYNRDTGRRDVEPYQALIVRRIFERYAETRSFAAVCGELNDANIPAFAGGQWYPITVRRVLMNEAYTGRTVYRRTKRVTVRGNGSGRRSRVVEQPVEEWIEIPDATPEIIEPGLWARIQDILDDPARTARRPVAQRDYALRGRLRCTLCSNAMVGQTLRSKGKPYHYYRCRHVYARVPGRQCDGKYVPAGLLEAGGVVNHPRRADGARNRVDGAAARC